MKKNMKAMLSFLFVLVFLVQMTGVMASASYGTGSEYLAYEAYFPAPTAENPNAYARLTEDEGLNQEILGDKTFSVTLGGMPLSQSGGINSISELMNADLIITPPEGYYVSKLYLRGDSYDPDTTVSTDASAAYPYGDLSAAAVVTWESDKAFTWSGGGNVFRTELASSPAQSGYFLVIYFDEIEYGSSLTVNYSALGYMDPDYGYTGDYFTVRSLPDDQLESAHAQGLDFTGWVLRYDENDTTVEVPAGSQIAPYANCTLEAQWDTYEAPAPVYEEPAPEEPAYEEPAPEGPAYEEPVNEEPVYEEPAPADPVYEEPVVEEPANDYPDGPSSSADAPAVIEPAPAEPTYEEPSTDGPVEIPVEEPSNSGPVDPGELPSNDGPVDPGEQPSNDGPVDPGNNPYTAGPGSTYDNPYADGPSASDENPYADGPAAHQDQPTNGSGTGPSSGNQIDGPGSSEVVIPGTDVPAPSGPNSTDYHNYAVLEGHNGRWALNSSNGLSFRIGADFRQFSSLDIDHSATVSDSYYTVSSGASSSTTVLVSPSFLNGLSLGSHAFTFNFTDGSATAAFVIENAAAPEIINLTIKVLDVQAQYSGQNILGNGYEIKEGGLYPGDSLTLTYKGGSVNVTNNGKTEVDTYALADMNGNDASGKYNLTFLPGNVTVTPLTITLAAQDYSRPANGSAFNFASEYNSIRSYGALNGHRVSVAPYLAQNGYQVSSAVNQGSYDIMVKSITVRDAYGNDVSGNYVCDSLNKKLATLNITAPSATEIPVTITVTDNIWTYDGKPHTVKDYAVTGLVDGDRVDVTFANNNITNAGEYHVIQSYRITNNGVAVPDRKYKVTLNDTVTVQKFTITLTAESASKGYDGTALRNDNVKASALANSNHRIAVNFAVKDSSGNIIKNGAVNVGTYSKEITNVTIKDGNTDVTNNYDVRKVNGTLTITPSNGQVNPNNSPKTGDQNNIGLWIAILVASLLAVAAVAAYLILKKRGGKKKDAAKQPPRDRR